LESTKNTPTHKEVRSNGLLSKAAARAAHRAAEVADDGNFYEYRQKRGRGVDIALNRRNFVSVRSVTKIVFEL